jgi:transcriptional regulator with XRE-family HTH domain
MLNRIRELRLKKGWKQEELAELLHTKRQTIGHYETGERGIDADTICKLCDVFGCTADYLLCRSSRPAPELTPAEEELLLAYAAAPREIRTIVDTALAPYQKSTESSTA